MVRIATRPGSSGGSRVSARRKRFAAAAMSGRSNARMPADSSLADASIASARASSSRAPMRLTIAEGLLEVVADDLLQLLDPLPGDPHAPVGEPTVLLGAALLGDRGVRGIADQDVPELERVLAGDRRSCLADELLAHERAHERPRVRAVRFREELPDRTDGGRPCRSPRRIRSLAVRRRSIAPAWRPATPRPRAGRRSRRDPRPASIRRSSRPPSSRTTSPSSISIDTICSTNSGFPPPASATRSAASAGSRPPPRRLAISWVDASASSGGSVSADARCLPAPQAGRESRNSGLAVHSSRIGASLAQSATWSIASSSAGSAQWTSSHTAITGRSLARISKNRRIAQAVSSGAE